MVQVSFPRLMDLEPGGENENSTGPIEGCLSQTLIAWLWSCMGDNVSFGIATHNSFHKGKGREEDDVFPADLTEYFFRLIASAFGQEKFEVITAGNPDRSEGTNNLWNPERAS